MKLYSIKATLLALVSLAVISTSSAKAAAGFGDLLVEFTQVGAANDVVYDIGSVTPFLSGTSYSVDLSAQLTAAFGGVNAANVYYQVIGGTGSGGATANGTPSTFKQRVVFATSAEASTLGDTPLTAQSSSFQATANTFIQGTYGALNSNFGSNLISTTNGGSATAEGQYNLGQTINGTLSQNLDLYTLKPSTTVGAPSGFFSISNGVVTYTGAAAAPEPSSYVLVGLGLVALTAIVRRRQAAL